MKDRGNFLLILAIVFSSCVKQNPTISLEDTFLRDYAGYCSVYQNTQLIKPYIYAKRMNGRIMINIDQYWTEGYPSYRNVGLIMDDIPAKEGYINFKDDSTFIGLITYKHGYDLIDANYKIKPSTDNYVNITELTDQSVKGFFRLSFEQDTSIRKNHVAFMGNTVVYENGFFEAVLQ